MDLLDLAVLFDAVPVEPVSCPSGNVCALLNETDIHCHFIDAVRHAQANDPELAGHQSSTPQRGQSAAGTNVVSAARRLAGRPRSRWTYPGCGSKFQPRPSSKTRVATFMMKVDIKACTVPLIQSHNTSIGPICRNTSEPTSRRVRCAKPPSPPTAPRQANRNHIAYPANQGHIGR